MLFKRGKQSPRFIASGIASRLRQYGCKNDLCHICEVAEIPVDVSFLIRVVVCVEVVKCGKKVGRCDATRRGVPA